MPPRLLALPLRLLRALLAASAFALFGLGGLLVSLLLLLIPSRRAALATVRFTWRLFAGYMRLTGLIRVHADALPKPSGAIIVANHPSLIDVVLLIALLPRTTCLVKDALRHNPFVGIIVRRVFLSQDASLLDHAPAWLAAGNNLLIFPEGTRTPVDAPPPPGRPAAAPYLPQPLLPFHRGPAQLAIRTGAPIQPIQIRVTSHILGKSQFPLAVGAIPCHYHFTALPVGSPAAPAPAALPPPALARSLTDRLRTLLSS